MVAIARAGVARDAPTVTPKRSSPNLDAQLRTYRAQLADWVTCPSAKTPEGKAKIEQISAKLNSVKSEIKKSDGTSPSATTAPQTAATKTAAPQTMPNDSTRPADGGGDYLTAPSQVGANVDTYA